MSIFVLIKRKVKYRSKRKKTWLKNDASSKTYDDDEETFWGITTVSKRLIKSVALFVRKYTMAKFSFTNVRKSISVDNCKRKKNWLFHSKDDNQKDWNNFNCTNKFDNKIKTFW